MKPGFKGQKDSNLKVGLAFRGFEAIASKGNDQKLRERKVVA
jgi:hypothetical protein